jgi:uncharacterized membrane protein
MEHHEEPVTVQEIFEEDFEKASNAYLMSLVSLIISFPLPIVNLIATLLYYNFSRKENDFVRWHCVQSLLSQVFLVFFNSPSLYFIISYYFKEEWPPIPVLAFIGFVVLLNLFEYIATAYAASVVRNGGNIRWWGFSQLADRVVGENK